MVIEGWLFQGLPQVIHMSTSPMPSSSSVPTWPDTSSRVSLSKIIERRAMRRLVGSKTVPRSKSTEGIRRISKLSVSPPVMVAWRAWQLSFLGWSFSLSNSWQLSRLTWLWHSRDAFIQGSASSASYPWKIGCPGCPCRCHGMTLARLTSDSLGLTEAMVHSPGDQGMKALESPQQILLNSPKLCRIPTFHQISPNCRSSHTCSVLLLPFPYCYLQPTTISFIPHIN
ncbi:hypothetical protein IE53DRAFT_35525 [Violaceomyces palustris]|uniref:Uncharacterized protein n=1 Tax=Violaceomyces palustris TaxID=1673888 RepID=A0ACD0P117_9BASI|nr:hypothetical protein IE53DRAFT_35525 [Violaceomyces palustris]